MDLLIIFLFIVSYRVSGSSLEGSDLLNDVGTLEVQGYEVHEKFADRKEQGRPHFVTTTVHRHGSSRQNNEGSSTLSGTGDQISQHRTVGGTGDQRRTLVGTGDQSSQYSYGSSTLGRTGDKSSQQTDSSRSNLGGTEELKTSLDDNVDIYKTAVRDRAMTSGSNVAGMEIIKIFNPKTNSHATPYNSVWSDSIKHSVGEDATFTHKPIIVRHLTLSEVDNGTHNDRIIPEERYTGEHISPKEHYTGEYISPNDRYTGDHLSPGVLKVNAERSSANSPVALKAQSINDADRFRDRKIVRQPYYSSYGSQAGTGVVESSGSPYSSVDEEESVLHTTTSPNVLIDQNPSSVIQDETPVVDVQRGIQGGYPTNDEHQDELKFKKSLSTSMLSSGTQQYLDHSATGESGDRGSLFPSQPRHILDQNQQNIFGRYPYSNGEYLFNYNGYRHPSISSQLDLESYSSRPSYTIPHQHALHHIEHAFRSSPNKGYIPLQVRDEPILGRDIFNHNLYFPSYPDGEIASSFGGGPFMRPPPSISSYPSEEAVLGVADGFINV